MKTHLTPEMTSEILASAKANGDEFAIVAFKADGKLHFWTRNKLDVAKFIADGAVERAGFARALVWNCFHGYVSDVLYTASVK